jgi:hypothetical protein
MNTIKSIEYVVHHREMYGDFCIIENMKLSDGQAYQAGIKYGLTKAEAEADADVFQFQFASWGLCPAR